MIEFDRKDVDNLIDHFQNWKEDKKLMTKWIPINEDYDFASRSEVLATNGSEIVTGILFKKEYLNGLNEVMCEYSACCGCDLGQITHWAKLPELPKDEK